MSPSRRQATRDDWDARGRRPKGRSAPVEREVILPPDVIKIDVKGAELKVFRGAAGVIGRSCPYILFAGGQRERGLA